MKKRVLIYTYEIFVCILFIMVANNSAQNKGNIQITCPTGFRVYLDDELMGLTSDKQDGIHINKIVSGKHEIRVEKTGYNTNNKSINVIKGKTIELTITPTKIETTPEKTIGVQSIPLETDLKLLPLGKSSLGTCVMGMPQCYFSQIDMLFSSHNKDSMYYTQAGVKKVIIEECKISFNGHFSTGGLLGSPHEDISNIVFEYAFYSGSETLLHETKSFPDFQMNTETSQPIQILEGPKFMNYDFHFFISFDKLNLTLTYPSSTYNFIYMVCITPKDSK